MANNLRRKSQAEIQTKQMIVDAVCDIGAGVAPQIIEESLYAYLSGKERKGVSGGGG
jgi:chemotaxis protein MotA